MIKIEDVQIKYDDFIALNDINFEVKEGEFFTLLGPSGSGKSTMLRAIVGFLSPSKGKIKVANEVINNKPVETRGIGMVFQSYALFPNMSVYDNIAFGLKVDKKDKTYIDNRVRELAEMVDLTSEQVQKNVSELSGGQQQRVAITRSLAKKPNILAMDEPLSNLDARLRKQLRKELKKIQNELNVTTLYVTHDQEEALTLSDRIAVFSNGKLEQVGTPEEIYNHPQSEFVLSFVGDSNTIPADIVKKINPTVDFNEYKRFYIRPENLSIRPAGNEIKDNEILVEYVDQDFYGTHLIYTVIDKATGFTFNTLESSSKLNSTKVGEELILKFDTQKILKYKGGE